MSHYQEFGPAIKYLDFLNSKNGEIQKAVLFKAINSRLPKGHKIKILDAACGNGWLSGMLKKEHFHVDAFDASEFFIQFAKSFHKDINFKVADIEKPLPYQKHAYNVVILNMVGPDIKSLRAAFKNLSLVLKPGGKLIMTIPNPKFTYPAAVWKRGILGFLLLQKPQLKLKTPPLAGEKIKREFGKNLKIDSYYYTLDSYIQNAHSAGLQLKENFAITSKTDSPDFDLNYQLFRYPLLLLLEFEKTS